VKALVTGGAGFIGSHVVDAYLAQGMEVVIIDDLSTGHMENVNPSATFYRVAYGGRGREGSFRPNGPRVFGNPPVQLRVRLSLAIPSFMGN